MKRNLKLLALVGVFSTTLVLGTGCTNQEMPVEEETQATQLVDHSETTEETDSSLEQNELEEFIEGYLAESMDSFRVNYDSSSKTFNFVPKTIYALDMIVEIETNDEVRSAWDQMASGFAEISEGVYETLGNGYYVNIVNPRNEENVLLMCKDGEIVYEFTEDL